MGKKKDAKAEAQAAGGTKSAAPKLPKRIAGVKLSKEVRRSGDALIARANSPEGRQAITSGLAMAGAALMAARAGAKSRSGPTPVKPGDSGTTAPPAPPVGDAIGAAVDRVLARLLAGRPG